MTSNQNTKGQSMPLKTIECNCSTYGKHGLHDPKCDSLKISKWKEELGDLIENWPDLDNPDSCYSLSKEVIRTVKALLTSQKADMIDTLIEEVGEMYFEESNNGIVWVKAKGSSHNEALDKVIKLLESKKL